MSQDEFWRSTPREIASAFDAAAIRRRRDHNDRVWLAYHIEAFSRTKRLPSLNSLLLKERAAPRRRQTWQEQLAIMDLWVIAMAPKKDRNG